MRRSVLGPGLAGAGALVLLVAVVLPWYAWGASGGGGGITFTYSNSYTIRLYPGSTYTDSRSGACSGATPSICGASNGEFSNGTRSVAYDGQLRQTGSLYAAIEYLVVGAGIVALLGVVADLAGRRRNRRVARVALALLLLSALLAVGAIATATLETPSALSADRAGVGEGPWSTYLGSCTYSASASSHAPCGFAGATGSHATASWGPDLGWYVALVGAILLVAGTLFSWRARARPLDAAGSAPPS